MYCFTADSTPAPMASTMARIDASTTIRSVTLSRCHSSGRTSTPPIDLPMSPCTKLPSQVTYRAGSGLSRPRVFSRASMTWGGTGGLRPLSSASGSPE